MDDSGVVVSASSTLTYPHYLYPAGDAKGRDRGQFIIRMSGPVLNASRWKIYSDALVSSNDVVVPEFNTDIKVARTYYDEYGSYHLVGLITNNGTEQISPSLLGGLYDQNGVVLDAASLSVPIYLNTGASSPFDLNSFGYANSLSPDDRNIDHYDVRSDDFWTYSSTVKTVPLEANNVTLIKDGSVWTISGQVTNTSTYNLTSLNVVIAFLDADNNVAATNYAYVGTPDGSDSIKTGAISDFSISIYSAQGDDYSSSAYKIIAQAVVAE